MNKKPAKFKIIAPKGYHRKSLPYFQELVDALESGRFRQVTGTLCESTGSKSVGYCCLGVLSRVQGRLIKDDGNWYDQALLDKSGSNKSRSDCDLNRDNPAYKVLRNDGRFPVGIKLIMTDNDEVITSLIGCNDDGKLSFKEIAQVIRRIWKA